ncbi:ROK family protein [Weissella cibaria]|uniref:ROK family protein n=1 Tax=Weissella cibaria TaxID=137591 RepID=UPI001CD45844|nr:ROK family protein [Weissella cibaria]MCA1355858.1 ROK family protein [Weissella cibaria]MDQ2125003.1 ROK family protein [Weissella cibaria]MDQ2157437.1 ROK family protein [Weissella cibaria]
MTKNYLAIDVGGTRLKVGLIDRAGNIIEKYNERTVTTGLPEFLVQLHQVIDRYADQIRGVAFSVPGKVAHPTDTIKGGGALTFMDGVNLRDELQLDLPVAVENDGKAAALAELWLGELNDVADGMAIVLGTGVGGGLVLNGELVYGTHYQAGELSFIFGQIETGMETSIGLHGSAVEMIKRIGTQLQLPEIDDGLTVFEHINAGEPAANEIFDAYANQIALLIQNIQAITDIQRIVIGGGISAQPIVAERIREKYLAFFNGNELVKATLTPAEIVAGKFANDANLFGAVYHLLMQLNQEV